MLAELCSKKGNTHKMRKQCQTTVFRELFQVCKMKSFYCGPPANNASCISDLTRLIREKYKGVDLKDIDLRGLF